MSHPFDPAAAGRSPGRPVAVPRSGGSRRPRRVLLATVVTLGVLFVLVSVFTSVWTDRLWFGSLGEGDVFSTLIFTRLLLFVVAGALLSGVVCLNIWLAHRFSPTMPGLRAADPVLRYREVLEPVRRRVLVLVAALLFVLAGSVAAGAWRTYLLWRNGGAFGVNDEFFGRDIGFFIFDYPFIRFVLTFGFVTLGLAIVAAAVTHYVYGGISLEGRSQRVSGPAQVQLSVLLGLFLLLKSVAYWLDKYGFAFADGNLFTGISYTDANARIPSKNILVFIALICALLLFANVVRRSFLLPGIGIGLLLVSAALIGGVWPAVLQSFTVRPSEPDKEAPYIARNITATRDAFDVADVETVPYTATTELPPAQLTETAESTPGTRLLDPTLVAPAFEQLQQVRGYYSVPTTLDVDRYLLEGEKQRQDVVIAARELTLDGLPPESRSWSVDHTIYTHGYGVIAARGNDRTAQGEPVWVERDIPPIGELDIEQPRIYFGEQSPEYSIVGAPEGTEPVEVDRPRGADTEETESFTYDGTGGVEVGSVFNKALYALKFDEPNILLSGRVNEASKILYDRSPGERVAKVAPWLTVDGDPYPAVVDGRIVWIVDGYTTSSTYPYAEQTSLRDATSDTLTDTSAVAALPNDQVNYMRNSVKAVVDAYDGTVDLYEWDTEDPVLDAWQSAFPGLVQDNNALPDAIRDHFRYPEDLFKVQRSILATYHVTEELTFYEGSEAWKIPEDPAGTTTGALQPPYYLSVQGPEEKRPSFSLTSVYLPNAKQNLASFISVNSETSSDNYGDMQILQLPTDTQVPGPSQVANAFQSDPAISDELLPFKQSTSTTLSFGNLLTLPVGDGLLYVQPVYVERVASEGSYPVLQYVLATFGDQVGFGETLDGALRMALGLEAAPETDPNAPSDPPRQGTSTADQYLADAEAAYEEAQAALAANDFATYGEKIEEVQRLVQQAREALAAEGDQPEDAPSAEPSADPSPDPASEPTETPTTTDGG